MSASLSFLKLPSTVESRQEISFGGTALIHLKTYESGMRTVQKTLLPKLRNKPDYEELLSREFQILRDLSHPFIVKAFSYREFSGKKPSTLELEFVPGQTLEKVLEDLESFETEERREFAYDFLRQLNSAIGYLHAHQIIHGDLCPENMIVDDKGFLRLIDFATATHPKIKNHSFQIRGKQVFRAPEIKASGVSTVEGDIFAVGKIFEGLLGPAAKDEDAILLKEMLDRRRMPFLPLERAWFQSLNISKSKQMRFFPQRRRTQLIHKKTWRTWLPPVALAIIFASTSSLLPLRGRISVNALPYTTKVAVEALGSHIWWERALREVDVPAGRTRVTFVIPSQNNRAVIRDVMILPGENLKVFEDFQKN